MSRRLRWTDTATPHKNSLTRVLSLHTDNLISTQSYLGSHHMHKHNPMLTHTHTHSNYSHMWNGEDIYLVSLPICPLSPGIRAIVRQSWRWYQSSFPQTIKTQLQLCPHWRDASACRSLSGSLPVRRCDSVTPLSREPLHDWISKPCSPLST